ncbi:MAG TPA: hypothetical protein VKM94_03430 [Blastocatellia bacterium]|nr:hypothetical protein [Blastocatellia bacterium]
MKSEIIVVLILTAMAIGFILWIRSKSQPDDPQRKPQDVYRRQ